jgi:glyoxylase-like metal-dependent hydrolase (beta-lactamase superfamily II)
LGGLEVAYTPGHASHHVSYWHPESETAFVGDVAGVRAAGSGYVLAPTPPPDIDLEAWAQSLERVREWRPREVAITHFGRFEALVQLDAIERSLEVAGQRSRELSEAEFTAATQADIDADEYAPGASVYALGAPLDQLYAGLERYWSKREAPQ